MSGNIAMIFPGQGSQHIGMGEKFYSACDKAKGMFGRANEILGYSLTDICFTGPEEELKKTVHTQPALYVCGAVALEAARAKGVEFSFTAGHSLGEYTALYAAGVFDFETGLNLVKTRAEAMHECATSNQGAMAAIIGLPGDKVTEICTAASDKGVVQPANFNDPTQVVISGSSEGIDEACQLAKDAGAKRAMPLPVSGAFHSPLMAQAEEKMREALAEVVLQAPKVKFINNVDAEFLSDPDAIKESLARQITGSVRWVDSIERLRDNGAALFVETGPGRVLQGLIRRIDRSLLATGFGAPEELEKALADINS